MQIVATVATLEECDPIELPPLFDAVDPEALDALFSDTDNGVKLVRVSYCGYVIDVTPSRFVVRAAN
nr:HalOD1 output domain-containing protein [Natronorubrum texcoconense]